MTSQPGKQTNTVHILPNILNNNANEKMKFGQLMQYNLRNTFLEISSYTKCGGETIPFLKNQN